MHSTRPGRLQCQMAVPAGLLGRGHGLRAAMATVYITSLQLQRSALLSPNAPADVCVWRGGGPVCGFACRPHVPMLSIVSLACPRPHMWRLLHPSSALFDALMLDRDRDHAPQSNEW